MIMDEAWYVRKLAAHACDRWREVQVGRSGNKWEEATAIFPTSYHSSYLISLGKLRTDFSATGSATGRASIYH